MFFELESKQMSQFLFLLLSNNVKSNLIEVRIQGRSQCFFLFGEIVQIIVHNIAIQRQPVIEDRCGPQQLIRMVID